MAADLFSWASINRAYQSATDRNRIMLELLMVDHQFNKLPPCLKPRQDATGGRSSQDSSGQAVVEKHIQQTENPPMCKDIIPGPPKPCAMLDHERLIFRMLSSAASGANKFACTGRFNIASLAVMIPTPPAPNTAHEKRLQQFLSSSSSQALPHSECWAQVFPALASLR